MQHAISTSCKDVIILYENNRSHVPAQLRITTIPEDRTLQRFGIRNKMCLATQ